MIIKHADDKAARLRMLENLLTSPTLGANQRQWAGHEAFRFRMGCAGERSAAHYLDNYLKDDPERMLIHDLRVDVAGEVAQIDHLMVTRGLHFYLIETKSFNGRLTITDRGEFSVLYGGGREYGIESPLEQCRRHERVLAKLLDQLEIRGRLGMRPMFHHCVLIDPKGTIARPDAAAFDTSSVIKADQFAAWHQDRITSGLSLLQVASAMANIVSATALQDLAARIAHHHQPANPLALPDFMASRSDVSRLDEAVEPPASARPLSPPADHTAQTSTRRRLICSSCGAKLTFAEGKFCWNNEARFGGLQYCREHQAAH